MAAAIKMDEIAARINVHLQRLEADETLNQRPDGKGKRYFHAVSHASRSRVNITYVSYQYTSSLTKAEALRYLATVLSHS